MAKYKLIQKEDNKINNILFNKIDDFRDLSKDSLKDIVKFTGMFKDKKEMSKYLQKYRLIKGTSEFNIIYRYGKKDKYLDYGLSFKEDLIFFNESNLKKFAYQNHMNRALINNLCNIYINNENQINNVYSIKNYLESENFGSVDVSNEVYLDYLIALDRLIETECSLKGSKIENFRKLRDLAMFFSNEYKFNENLKFENFEESNDLIKYVDNKKKVLKNKGKQKIKQEKSKQELSFIF